MKTCPYCAEEVRSRARICPHCESDLEDDYDDRPRRRRSNKSSSSAPVWIIVLVVCAGGAFLLLCVGAALFLPAIQSAREAARRVSCKNNLRQISVALEAHMATHKSFPPSATTDAPGQSPTSWRVGTLTFLGEAALNDAYDRSQAWDSPTNMALLPRNPDVYRCPSAPGDKSLTTYAGVSGPGTMFDPAENGVKEADVRDAFSQTLLVGEVKDDAGIRWTEPRDVDVSRNPGINAGGFGSNHPGGAQFVFGDGTVRFISSNIDPETLRRLFQRNDGMPVGNF